MVEEGASSIEGGEENTVYLIASEMASVMPTLDHKMYREYYFSV